MNAVCHPTVSRLGVIVCAAAQRLAQALNLDTASARIETHMLLGKVLSVPRSYLIMHAEKLISADELQRFSALLERRLAGEPMAYILGEREFYGLSFIVNNAVLIPRPETEHVVEAALERIPVCADLSYRALDLGTGSGAIAIALATQRPYMEVIALDISMHALAVAQQNVIKHRAFNVSLLQSDWCQALTANSFDMILANPPYIAENDFHLTQGDLRFEPRLALACEESGLQCVREIVVQARTYLKPRGWLIFEHGFDQADACRQLLRQQGFIEVGSASDLSGTQRVTYGRTIDPE